MKNTLHEKRGIARKGVWARIGFYTSIISMFCIVAGATFFVIEGKRLAQLSSKEQNSVSGTNSEALEVGFPIGVDPKKKEITENPIVSAYFEEHISSSGKTEGVHAGWFSKALGKLALMNWYQNLASLSSRILVIQPGERKEQVAHNFGKILGWNEMQKTEFIELIQSTTPELEDGKFFPSTYTIHKCALPTEVAPLVLSQFDTEVLTRYSEDITRIIPLEDALIVASLLEREAYDFTDMRHIAGVIWNRLFIDMKLQLDATLQYAKGSRPTEAWWPKVRPQDKYIDSPYNTYENEGLPPTPIANPSLEAILAALNPSKTDCMYYFHDKQAGFHCTKTYEEHVTLLKQYYGRGR